jgi:hypothetical protein
MTLHISRYSLGEIKSIRLVSENKDVAVELSTQRHLPSSLPREFNNEELTEAVEKFLQSLNELKKLRGISIEIDFEEPLCL